MPQPGAGAFDDGKAQPHPFGRRGAAVQAAEFLEDHGAVLVADAGAAVPDLDADGIAAPARAHEDPAPFGIADGVGDQVLHDPLQI